MNFSRIMCAVDRDSLADAVFETASELAEKLGAELAVVSVLDLSLMGSAEDAPLYDTQALFEAETDRLLDRLLQRKKTIPITKFVEEGNPKRLIVDIADRWGADIVLIASHGRKGLTRVLMGSVAESVVRASRCPVMIIPARH